MNEQAPYQALADRLNSFPQGFPPTADQAELKLLAKLFTPAEAHFAAHFSLSYTPLAAAAEKAGIPLPEARQLAKSMTQKGLTHLRREDVGIEMMLLPFIIGFYENQVATIDEEFAQLFEDYYSQASPDFMALQPQFHRVIPVNETIGATVEILPGQSLVELVASKKAWAVQDCICRKQQALLGKGCDHPVKNCLVMSDVPGVFDGQTERDALTLESALTLLDEAAESGLIHTISNQQSDITYICNCCTCSCGILRSIADAPIANVVARSAYVSQVDETLCIACGNCDTACQFSAISIDGLAHVDANRCVGCGLCIIECPESALSLALRPMDEILETPYSFSDWLAQRAAARRLL